MNYKYFHAEEAVFPAASGKQKKQIQSHGKRKKPFLPIPI